jgi:hypothetical protein
VTSTFIGIIGLCLAAVFFELIGGTSALIPVVVGRGLLTED